MKKTILTILFPFILWAQIVPYIGIAKSTNENKNSISGYESMTNPIGLFGIAYETDFFTPYYRHLSSIPEEKDGHGLNEIGININIKNEIFTLYLGRSYHNIYGDSFRYESIGDYSNILGLEINYHKIGLFIEQRNSQNDDMNYFGLLLKF